MDDPEQKKRDAYDKKKKRVAEKDREKSAVSREIGPLPEVEDPERRARAAVDLRFCCETYGAQTFAMAWSEDHLDVIRTIQNTVLSGGQYALAMPRGSGKTSIVLWACIWAILNGLQQYIVLIGATASAAEGLLKQIKDELETNELLIADYPEVCYVISRLEGVNQRRLLFNGEPVKMTFTNKKIVLPNLPDSISSGSVIGVAGLTGSIRGLNHRLPDGRKIRPGMVLLDDPQTDTSAVKPGQCDKRERLIIGAVLGLAGPGKKIAAVMCCTVIATNDLSDRFLDHEKHPEWHGKRTALLKKFPKLEGDQLELWMAYAEERQRGLDADDDGAAANAFYLAHRIALDAGFVAAWAERKLSSEVSAIQHAMNLYFTDKYAFFAEYQNDPSGAETEEGALTPTVIMSRVHGFARGVVPPGCVVLTAGIDVQGDLLYWVVVAWEANFTGYIIDYGSYPDQKRPYYTNNDARKTLSREFKGASREGRIYQGLTSLCTELLTRDFTKPDGEVQRIERCFIDQGFEAKTVRKFAAEAVNFRTQIMPSKGSGKPLRPNQNNKIDQGEGWAIPPVAAGRIARECTYDSSMWTTFIRNRFGVVPGQRGSLTLWHEANNPRAHALLADHIDAEVKVGVEIDNYGERRDKWELRPGRPDNHLGDGVKMAAVAAATTRKVKFELNPNPLPPATKKKRKAKCYDLKED